MGCLVISNRLERSGVTERVGFGVDKLDDTMRDSAARSESRGRGCLDVFGIWADKSNWGRAYRSGSRWSGCGIVHSMSR